MDSNTKWKSKKIRTPSISKINLTKDFNYKNISLPGIEPLMNTNDDLDFDPDRPFIKSTEGFSDKEAVIYDTDLDQKENTNIDPNESHMLSPNTGTTESEQKAPEGPKSSPDPKQKTFFERVGVKIPNIAKSTNRLFSRFNKENLQKWAIDLIEFGPACFEWIFRLVALCIVYPFFDDLDAKIALKAYNFVFDQIYGLVSIPIGLFITLNWWYIINYTNHYTNFGDVLKFPIFGVFFYAIEPAFFLLEVMNYYIMGLRVDKNLSPYAKSWLNYLWEYRPITISLLFYIFCILFYNASYTSMTTDFIKGKKNPLFYLIFILIIFVFMYLTPFDSGRQLEFVQRFGNIFVVIFAFIMIFLFVIIFSYFSLFLYQGYILFFSMFSMLFYVGIMNVFSITQKMREDIKDVELSPNTEENKTSRFFKWLWQYLYKNTFEITINFAPALLSLLYARDSYSKYANDKPAFAITLAIIYLIFTTISLFFLGEIGSNIFSRLSKTFVSKDEESEETPTQPQYQNTGENVK